MKLLIFDTIFPVGHKDLNNRLIELMSQFSELIVLNKSGYYSEKQRENIRIKTSNLFLPIVKNVFINQCFQLWNFLIAILTVVFVRYDKVLFFTYDTIGFSIGRFLFLNKNVYLFHHRNTAELSNKYKRIIFSFYSNTVNHIVFTDFIKAYLVNELHVPASSVSVLPHPLIFPDKVSDKQEEMDQTQKMFVGLGYANDEQLLKDIVTKESETHILEKHGVKLILRSKVWNHKGKTISIFKGHLRREEYDHYFYSTKAVLLLYPDSYKNRFSGAIMDAFIHGKVVIGTNVPIASYFSKCYPASCMITTSVDDLFNKIITFEHPSGEIMEKEHSFFLQQHSDQIVMYKLKQILNG